MGDLDRPAEHRDIVTIGASAGGIAALQQLLRQLPADFPAAIMVVQHIAVGSNSLPAMLGRGSALRVAWAEHNEPLAYGRVLVARPGMHLLLHDAKAVLASGPRENRARPSVNRLFRSAADVHGDRTIGVLLTGLLDDGVAGLAALKRSGALTVAQDPAEAEYESMPRRAIAAGVVDHVARLSAMGPLLEELVRRPPARSEVPDAVRREAELDRHGNADPDRLALLGEHTALTCPDCGGAMWQVGPAGARTYRCFVGHASSALTLLRSGADEVERSLWVAVRALDDRAMVFDKLALDAQRLSTLRSAAQYAERAAEARSHADRARKFLLDLERAIDRTDDEALDTRE